MNGTITVRRPRVRDLEERFVSRLLPLFQRRTPEVAALLPEHYLHGLALGDFELALRGLLGEGAPRSASSLMRLKATWQAQYAAWQHRDLSVRLSADLPVGRRGVREGGTRHRQGGAARADRRRRRGAEDGARRHERAAGVHRELGGGAAGPEAPWAPRAQADDRRRPSRDLECARAGLSRERGATLLESQAPERARHGLAEAPGGSEGRAAGASRVRPPRARRRRSATGSRGRTGGRTPRPWSA